MIIYGLVILSGCTLVGLVAGDLLGKAIQVDANVGGVGFAMLLMVLILNYLTKKGKISSAALEGINFWSGMYIPIVVAMTAGQNVVAALKGGVAALVAGAVAVGVAFLLIPVIGKLVPDQTAIEEKFEGAERA